MNYAKCIAFTWLLPGIATATDPLSPEIITVTGYPVELDRVIASAEVITTDEIQRSAATDLADILRFHAGIELGRNGGPGQAAALFLRGTESDHTLVLIDGVPINSASVGSAAVQHIDPQIVERIEIVKGPQSARWGSSAIGGVINIITHKANPDGVTFGGAMEGGGDATYRGNAYLNAGNNDWLLGISASHEQTDGFPSLQASQMDRGYDNTSINLGLTYSSQYGEISARHWQTQGNNEYLDFFLDPLDQDFLNSNSSLAWDMELVDGWRSQLSAAYVQDHIKQNHSSQEVETDRRTLSWVNDFTLDSKKILVLGVDYAWEDVDATGGFSPYSSDINYWEIFAQYDTWLTDKHHLKLGVRQLDHDDAGNHFTWSIGYGFQFSETTRLNASAATGFKVPTTNERFGFGGNPDLKPEESTSYEIAVKHKLSPGQQITAAIYRTDIDDLIEWTLVNPPWGGFNQNIAEARIEGLELTYDLSTGPWTLKLGGIWQDPIDTSNGDQLLRRAHYSLNGFVQYQGNNWHIGTSMLHSGERKDFGDVTLDSYTLINLDLSYSLTQDWRIYGKIENLLDEDYELASGYRTQDRIGYIGIQYR